MNELALFAGGGGGLLATKHLLGWNTVCYVEYAPYPVEILKARISEGYLDDAPIWDNVRTFDGQPWCGLVDIVTAGFPCQPFSIAGRHKADDDLRNGWPDTMRIIREVRPKLCLLENVPGLLSVFGKDGRRYFGRILRDLAENGYYAGWQVLSAAKLGARHKRNRVFILAADTKSEGLAKWLRGCGKDSTQDQAQKESRRDRSSGCYCFNGEWDSRDWLAEAGLQRKNDGVANRVDRHRAIGNGQVPIVVKAVWKSLVKDLCVALGQDFRIGERDVLEGQVK